MCQPQQIQTTPVLHKLSPVKRYLGDLLVRQKGTVGNSAKILDRTKEPFDIKKYYFSEGTELLYRLRTSSCSSCSLCINALKHFYAFSSNVHNSPMLLSRTEKLEMRNTRSHCSWSCCSFIHSSNSNWRKVNAMETISYQIKLIASRRRPYSASNPATKKWHLYPLYYYLLAIEFQKHRRVCSSQRTPGVSRSRILAPVPDYAPL